MEEIKNYTNILNDKLSNTINDLEEKSKSELEEIKRLNSNLFELQEFLDECVLLANQTQQNKVEEMQYSQIGKRGSISPSPIKFDFSERKPKQRYSSISIDHSLIEPDIAIDPEKMGK